MARAKGVIGLGLAGSKEFHCPHCGVRYHRDIGVARNNFLAAYGQAIGFGWDGTN